MCVCESVCVCVVDKCSQNRAARTHSNNTRHLQKNAVTVGEKPPHTDTPEKMMNVKQGLCVCVCA